MADTTFGSARPLMKAVDIGDETYAWAVQEATEAAVSHNRVFENTTPPLKAIDLGDGTFAIDCKLYGG